MKKNFKYIKKIADDKTEATILIYSPIGTFSDEITGEITYGVDGNCFAQEMLYLETQVNKINIRINSIGGSVIDGYSIISAIQNSTAKIHTFNDGLCASIAGLILISGSERSAKDYSITMIHNPSGGEQQSTLDKIKESLLTILKNNSILNQGELDLLMNEETYFNADEAKEAGLIDNIISSNQKVQIATNNVNELASIFNKLMDSEMKLAQETKVIELTETLTNVSEINNVEIKNEIESESDKTIDVVKTPDMIDKIKSIFGLNEDSSEEEVYDSIKNFKSKNEDLIGENVKLQDKLENLAAEAKKAHKTKIDAMINSFSSKGLIKADELISITNLANVDFDATKTMLEKLEKATASKSIRISDNISKEKITNTSTWTLEEYWKKDPTTLKQIQINTPEIYNQLVADYNSKTKNNNK